MTTRYFVAAGRYQIGQQTFYDWASELLYKEVEKEPRVWGREISVDGFVSVDGYKFKYLGQYAVTFTDGSKHLVTTCGCGECGQGGDEYSELLAVGWLTDGQMFLPNGHAKYPRRARPKLT